MSRVKNLLVDVRAHPLVMAALDQWARLFPAAYYLGNQTVLLRTVFGQSLYLDTRDTTLTPRLMLDGYWEKNVTRALLQFLSPGATFVEIGSNLGYFTTLAAARVGSSGRVYAFEANPSVADLLERNVALNGQQGWVRVVRQAVSDSVGEAAFHCFKYEQGSSTLRSIERLRLQELGDQVAVVNVPTVTLDAYFAHTDLRIDVVKMDAEGAEPLILAGMREVLERNPKLILIMEFATEMIRQSAGDPRSFALEIERLGYQTHFITRTGALRRVNADELVATGFCDVVLRPT